MQRLSAVVVLVTLCGCSLIKTKNPAVKLDASSKIVTVKCTTSRTPPIIDSVMTVALLVGTVVTAIAAVADESKGLGATAGGLGVGTLVFGGSAIVGFGRTSACRVAKRAEARVREELSGAGRP